MFMTARPSRVTSVTYPGRWRQPSLLREVRNLKVLRRAGAVLDAKVQQTLINRVRRELPTVYARAVREARASGNLAGLGDSFFDRVLDTVDKVGDTVEKFEPIWKGPSGSPTSTPTAKLGTGNANSPGARKKPPARRPAVVASGAYLPMLGMAAVLAALVMWSK